MRGVCGEEIDQKMVIYLQRQKRLVQLKLNYVYLRALKRELKINVTTMINIRVRWCFQGNRYDKNDCFKHHYNILDDIP